ncbi:sigma 54-interacting transcriptional regulator [Thermoanaerobacter siderophilus]|uniref:sigma 54-interacting transcriptional regulator n=1 Tax=Thermoanaerobacter siderophilus TaxID=106578 RepID=UPI00244C4CE2|nr:sigma 54-interacting transcriptional regulator [Thermoanaerobacter siderophilus]
MINLLNVVLKLARFDTTILLLGETGVGKSEIAKLIHDNSERHKGNFIEINCGAIPQNLLESELFGYEKGAFTGASKKWQDGFV